MSAASSLVLAIDQGTSATKCLLVDAAGAIVARAAAPLGESHPHAGWVEQSATELWLSVVEAVNACVAQVDARRIVAVGLSSQRESVVIWERASGEPIAPLVSWQDQRTAALCNSLRSVEVEARVRDVTGLPLDPMFSAAKMTWLLDRVDRQRKDARAGRLCLGTVDSWLLFRLTGAHLIEAGNASRTQLLDTKHVQWDDGLLALFAIPRAALPDIVPSIGPFPQITALPCLPVNARLCSVMADSHAALFGHGAYEPGSLKVTYGTGSSVMGLLDRPKPVGPGLCLTVAWQTDAIAHAAEGNIRSTGAALRWLAELLAITPGELVDLAATADSDGVALVPAFSGLGAPYWDRDAGGLLTGLTLKSGRAELARAAIEAVAHQVADVVDAFDEEVSAARRLFADGGPARSDVLMQLQADIAGHPVHRAEATELSALGAAQLAGYAAGIWSWDDLRALPRKHDVFAPACDERSRRQSRAGWEAAVSRARFRPSISTASAATALL